MYFVWKPLLRSWRGGLVRAEMRSFRPDWHRVIYRFDCESFRHLLPDRLEFDVTGAGGGLPDHIWSANFVPCSPRLAQLVEETGVEYEGVVATIWDKRTRKVLSDQYQYLHIMNCLDAADFDRSAVKTDIGRAGRTFIVRVSHLVLRDEIVEEGVPIFRLREHESLLLVHSVFKSEYERRGLWGSSFTPLDEYYEDFNSP